MSYVQRVDSDEKRTSEPSTRRSLRSLEAVGTTTEEGMMNDKDDNPKMGEDDSPLEDGTRNRT